MLVVLFYSSKDISWFWSGPGSSGLLGDQAGNENIYKVLHFLWYSACRWYGPVSVSSLGCVQVITLSTLNTVFIFCCNSFFLFFFLGGG